MDKNHRILRWNKQIPKKTKSSHVKSKPVQPRAAKVIVSRNNWKCMCKLQELVNLFPKTCQRSGCMSSKLCYPTVIIAWFHPTTTRRHMSSVASFSESFPFFAEGKISLVYLYEWEKRKGTKIKQLCVLFLTAANRLVEATACLVPPAHGMCVGLRKSRLYLPLDWIGTELSTQATRDQNIKDIPDVVLGITFSCCTDAAAAVIWFW